MNDVEVFEALMKALEEQGYTNVLWSVDAVTPSGIPVHLDIHIAPRKTSDA